MFHIEILSLYWKDETTDYPDDLCLHGDVVVTIGEEILEYECANVSATALLLLKTLTESCVKKEQWGTQMLPCCGFTFFPNDALDTVDICGCPNGIDWTIIHIDDNKVKHISDSGEEATIDETTYQKIVLDFADQVENFYKLSSPKIIPSDDFDKKGYLTFWKEWRHLRDKWK